MRVQYIVLALRQYTLRHQAATWQPPKGIPRDFMAINSIDRLWLSGKFLKYRVFRPTPQDLEYSHGSN